MDVYREIFEKFPDGVTLHDPNNGRLIDANQQFCDLLGYTHQELSELGFEDLHVGEPPYTADRAKDYIRKAATEGPQTFEWMDETKDGTALPVEVNLRLTTIDDEQRVLAVVRDISERKRRERDLERKNQQLEEFATIVSHDLRNPLSVAEGRLALARKELENEHLEAVARAHDRMSVLIDDLLGLAREGAAITEQQRIELRRMVENCWRTVGTQNATLETETTSSIQADKNRLRQLLENLIRNAVEHGGSNVTVTVGDHADGFYFEDDGPGVPPNIRSEIFDPGVSTSHDGTGFGLSIVKRVVEAHGWTIDLAEGEAGGARFEITDVGTA